MSYEIIYSVFTIKQGEDYYPYCICGSNNCTQLNYSTGREQRERNVESLNWLYKKEVKEKHGFKDIPLTNPTQVKDLLDFEGIKKYREDGTIQGRFTANAIYNNAVSKIIEAEELSARTKISYIYYDFDDEDKREKANEVREQIQAEIPHKILTEAEKVVFYEKFMNALQDEELEKVMRKRTLDYFYHTDLSQVSLKYALDRLKVKKTPKTYSKDELQARLENSTDKLKAEDFKPKKDREKDYDTAITDYETGLKEYREAIKEKFLGKQVIIKEKWSCNDRYRRGRIKAVGSEDIIGFFPTGKRRYHRIGFSDSGATIKVEEICKGF